MTRIVLKPKSSLLGKPSHTEDVCCQLSGDVLIVISLSGIGFFPTSFVISKGSALPLWLFLYLQLSCVHHFRAEPFWSCHAAYLQCAFTAPWHVVVLGSGFFILTNELYFLNSSLSCLLWDNMEKWCALALLIHSMESQMAEPLAGPARLCGWSCLCLLQDWDARPRDKASLVELSVEFRRSAATI